MKKVIKQRQKPARYDIHALANIMPKMPEGEFENLKADIEKNGILEPVTLLDGKIIDGRHRYRACQELKKACPTRTLDKISPKDLVRSMNLLRRHLSTSQRAMVAAALLESYEKDAQKRQKHTQLDGRGKDGEPKHKKSSVVVNLPPPKKPKEPKKPKRASEEVAKILNISAKTVRDGKTVKNEGTKEEVDAVQDGKAAVSATAKKVRKRRPQKKKPSGKMNETNENIGWAAYSWNPITGCKTGCSYCYADAMLKRFEKSFEPEFHENRLGQPGETKQKEGKNNRVFTCSMGEAFGPWVPDEWIEKTMAVVKGNARWQFLFLTKSPERLPTVDWPKNAWIGATADTQKRADAVTDHFVEMKKSTDNIMFLSCEPLLEEIVLSDALLKTIDWLIIGAESKGAKNIQPNADWVEKLLWQAREHDVSVYFKDNLHFRPQEEPHKN